MNRAYLDSVRLLLAVAPSIFRQSGFALKGGTAINLFHINVSEAAIPPSSRSNPAS